MAAKSDPGKVLGIVNVRNLESFWVTTTGGWFGMTGIVVIIATMAMRRAWMAKDEIKTHRFCGPRTRWNVEKNSAPRAKQTIATRDFAHEYRGAESG